MAEALARLPKATQALRDGQVCWSALRELTRVATAETEDEWLRAARGRTVREVEKLVSGHAVGNRPTDDRQPGLERHVLRFEVSAEVLASFREALAQLRRDAGGPLDDDAALRDGHRCVFPGCCHSTFVDLHHLRLQSEGGDHDPDNLVTVCGAHHRALHRGLITIEGTVASGLRFLHADGSPYGIMPMPLATDIASQAFTVLRKLGFRESEVRRTIADATHVGASPDVETLVRRCLLTLTEQVAKAS